ncbi:hypothetical protein [Natranaerobius thermophilus]|uniref:Uncharacterized protein n=1 Tax=Natranaerobius thermophilus (strain ATCC BAA-1301 / DSM 18059 / JW/NM-WN-LF) TaxID=457570 RepID=B2A437_NATTJ|nr:hypothetical protein [Natranaerobius thermophilus]ACB85141.1 hypothetical protein Nther_1566 [Natranaerobius thermophilus JW/NM-WN-LF]
MNLYWLIQAASFVAIATFFIPVNYIRKLAPFSIIGGIIYTIIVQYTAINILDLWTYKSTLFSVYGVPIFFVISWFAVTKLYGYFLMRYPSYQVIILIIFVLFTSLNNYISHNNDQVYFLNWSAAETFMFAVFSHVILLYFLKYLYKIDALGAKENMLAHSFNILNRKKE